MKIDFGFKKVDGWGSVFLRNNNLIALLPNDTSYYYGVSLLNGVNDPTKIIDSLIDKDYDSVKVFENSAVFVKNDKSCSIILSPNAVHINYEYENFLDIDFRSIYDFRTDGRLFEIKKGKYTIIKCIQGEENFYLATNLDISLEETWIEKNYWYDTSRNDNGVHWVYRLGKIFGVGSIGFGRTEKTAIANLQQKVEVIPFTSLEHLFERRMEGLSNQGQLYAGFPWFYQYWSRDQLTSIQSMPAAFRKKVLLMYKSHLLKDGRLPNRVPDSELGSADSIGLYALRVSQDLELFSLKEKNSFRDFFTTAALRLETHYLKDGLIYSNSKETWMDTIPREGFNIEIQAGYARILSLVKQLGGSLNPDSFVSVVREKFVNVDNVSDETIRPNIFLAYYIYPNLFEKTVWKEKFSRVINECYLDWGGLSSVSKNSWLFHPRDQGTSDESYHNGNTWYYINNIAGICLLNFPTLKKYSQKIYDASLEECLSQGLIGCCSEIGDAEERDSKGCFHQTWSIATLKELHSLLFNVNNSA